MSQSSLRDLIYRKYANYYTQRHEDEEPAVWRMIARAIELNETSCVLFEEHSNDDCHLTANDLEAIFEEGLKPLLERQLRHYKILKMRCAHTLNELEPYVTVSYILVWKRKDHPIFEDPTHSTS